MLRHGRLLSCAQERFRRRASATSAATSMRLAAPRSSQGCSEKSVWSVEVPVGSVAAAGLSAPGPSGSCVGMSTARSVGSDAEGAAGVAWVDMPDRPQRLRSRRRGPGSAPPGPRRLPPLGSGGLVHRGQDLVGLDPAQQHGLHLLAGKVALQQELAGAVGSAGVHGQYPVAQARGLDQERLPVRGEPATSPDGVLGERMRPRERCVPVIRDCSWYWGCPRRMGVSTQAARPVSLTAGSARTRGRLVSRPPREG